jgi:Uma2 family endonuclease
MAIRVGRSHLTYADFLELPDDGNRYEIIDGELYVSPSPSIRHQTVSVALTSTLHIHVRAGKLGAVFAAPTDVVFANDSIVEPDIVYISRARRAIVTDPNVQGAPDLVVEIISPSSTRTDQETKRDLYAKYGVQHYWLVHPIEEWIRAFDLNADGTYELVAEGNARATFSAPPFPDLAINLAELWDPFPDE